MERPLSYLSLNILRKTFIRFVAKRSPDLAMNESLALGMPVRQQQASFARLDASVLLPSDGCAVSSPKKFQTPQYRRFCRSEPEQAWMQWIHSFADWSVMVTLTFKRRSRKGFGLTESAIESAIVRFLRLINCTLFGKRRVNKGWTVACAATLDYGTYGDHPHAHILLSAPEGVNVALLIAVAELAAQKTSIVDRQRDYSLYFSSGGAGYLIKHGTDRMVVSLLTPARYGN